MRILHTADVHLGAKFLGLGDRGAEQRAQLFDTFSSVVDLALEEGVNLFLIAGDLFDSTQVSRELLARAASRLSLLLEKGIGVCVAPGTHDPYVPSSPFSMPPLSELEGLTVFTGEELAPARFGELDCTVYGNANTRPYQNKHPLAGFKPSDDCKWRVGMLHASFEVPDIMEDTYVVTSSEVAGCGLDYLALGHFHSLSDRSQGGVAAFYPGSPEMVRLQKGEFGNVLLVELGDTASVTPIEVGRRSFEELTVQAEQEGPAERLIALIESLADPDKVLKVYVEGLRRPEYPDVEALIDELRGCFFSVILDDRSRPAPASVDPENYPPDSPAGVFLRALEPGLQGATPGEKEEVLEAMQLGLSFLGEAGGD